ncbi:MAG: NAD(P)/FAD-dependent oxidoreductase [bacterium]
MSKILCDYLVIGAGMAGASIAYELQKTAQVLLVEMEPVPGYHATGRSSALYDPSYGIEPVRKMTLASRAFLDNPPDEFCDQTLLTPRGMLLVGRDDQNDHVQQFYNSTSVLIDTASMLDRQAIESMIDILRPEYRHGVYLPDCFDMDVAAQHLGYLKGFKRMGGKLLPDCPVNKMQLSKGVWQVNAGLAKIEAKDVINAAGAWAEKVASLCNAQKINFKPLQRHVFTFSVQHLSQCREWPMVMDAEEKFYFKPEGGDLLATPADEVPVPPGDALVDDLAIAVGVDRIEQATTINIHHINNSWAGLRTFSPDRNLVIGADAQQENFYWLAGQGGYGIMTAPANARLLSSLILGADLDKELLEQGVNANDYHPGRFTDILPT